MERSTLPNDDWAQHGACRTSGLEMIPDEDDGCGGSEIQLAKKVCAGCPVKDQCLLRAEQITKEFGEDYAQGLWGGLTETERHTMALAGRQPRPCSNCGLDHVPTNERMRSCSVCTQAMYPGLTEAELLAMVLLDRPPRPCKECGQQCVPVSEQTGNCATCAPQYVMLLNEYRHLIDPMIEKDYSVAAIAEEIGANAGSLRGAMTRWGFGAQARSQRIPAGCGTLTAKDRHRKNGQSWRDCACRDVPWRKRKKAVTT